MTQRRAIRAAVLAALQCDEGLGEVHDLTPRQHPVPSAQVVTPAETVVERGLDGRPVTRAVTINVVLREKGEDAQGAIDQMAELVEQRMPRVLVGGAVRYETTEIELDSQQDDRFATALVAFTLTHPEVS